MNRQINDQQHQAITSPLGPQLVLAGAGSGKTFVLIERIAHLIQHESIPPEKIWAITFTNKAAFEISERIQKRCGNAPNHINTFHGSCLWILRKHIHLLNRKKNFRVLDGLDQINFIKRLMKTHLSVKLEKLVPKKMLHLILHFKNLSYQPDEITFNDFMNVHLDFNATAHQNHLAYDAFKVIYQQYLSQKLAENLIDFDDILVLAEQLLAFEEVLTYWQNQFQAILVDEFQDTDELQFKIVRMLAQTHKNIFCVGDPDQSIYGWRGAVPHIFQDFLSYYPQCQPIVLEQNYRSSQKILNVANSVIAHNPHRMKKNLFTKNELGENIPTYLCQSVDEEAQWVINQIQHLQKTIVDLPLNQVVILYRNNHLTKPLEDALISHEIPYQISGAAKFYERVEIKTILSYLYLILGEDHSAIEQVYNMPRRKISETTFTKVIQYAQIHELSWLSAFNQAKDIPGLTNVAINGCSEFVNVIEELRSLNQTNLAQLIDDLLVITKYQAQLDPVLDQFRIANINYLKSLVINMQQNDPELTLVDFLSEMALHTEAAEINSKNTSHDKVQLMTIHTAKGLEFDYVFVTNLVQGILPSNRSLMSENEAKIAEERRLVYVACTRARKRLFLSGAFTYDPVTKRMRTHSQFLNEAKKSQALHWIAPQTRDWNETATNYQRYWNLHTNDTQASRFNTNLKIHKPIQVQQDGSEHQVVTNYQVGMSISHELYGRGVIVGMGQTGNFVTLKIKFNKHNKTLEILANNKKITINKS